MAPIDKSDRFADMGPTLAPFAHVVFCQKHVDDCKPGGDGRRAAPSGPETVKLLRAVNAAVNAAIRPSHDAKGPLGDVWTLSPKKGDCDDFAVTKRHRLIAQGLPVASLRLVVARTREGEGHAVLLVKTEDGDIVLDNRTSQLRSWRESGLSLLKIQSPADPRRWLAATTGIAAR